METQQTHIRTEDGFNLDAVISAPQNARKIVIMIHGLSADKDTEPVFMDLEKRLNAVGIATLRFSSRAHGASSGNPVNDYTISGQLKDLEAVVSYAQNAHYTWIGLVGASFGGGAAALYAGAHADIINALCLVNPVLDYDTAFLNPTTQWGKDTFHDYAERLKKDGHIKVGWRKYMMGPVVFDEMKEYTPAEALQSYYNRLFIVHGSDDEIVAVKDVYDIFINLETDSKIMESIPGGTHGFKEEDTRKEAVELIEDFFASEG